MVALVSIKDTQRISGRYLGKLAEIDNFVLN
jgi:hypothetical protein